MSDGLLLSKKEKLRVFWLKFLYGAGPSLLLVITALGLGDAAVGWTLAVFGVLLGFLVATNARTYRGALIGGIAVALVLFLFQIVVAWFVTHPIEKS